jgi:hypothetical protein
VSFLPGPNADGGSGMGEPSHHHTATMASAVSPNDSKAGTAVRRVRKRDTALPLTLEPRHAKRGGLRRALCWTKPGPSWHATRARKMPQSRPNRVVQGNVLFFAFKRL